MKYKKSALLVLLSLAATLQISCSGFEKKGECVSYTPGCITGVRHCEINSQGCETCTCKPWADQDKTSLHPQGGGH